MSGIERVRVVVPTGFDPSKQRHSDMLMTKVTDTYGEGFSLDHIDRETDNEGKETLIAVVTRQAAVTEVQERNDIKIVSLGRGIMPNEGDKWSTKMADTYPGWTMIDFDPWNGRATLAQMTPEEIRCRGALANALMCKPWDVKVKAVKGGGFDVKLPNSYVPSKHDTKIDEVATTVIGQFGWYVEVDARNLTARIVPSKPPTFPEIIPFPFGEVRPVADFTARGDRERFTLNLAEGLSAPGGKNSPVPMTLDDSTALLLVGLPGSGKSVAVQSIVYQALIKGYRLAVIDTPAKKTDFSWAKPYVHDHWWGCDDAGTSVAEALTVATLVDEEGKRIGELLNSHGVGKWQDLPAAVKKANPPILVVADELANLLSKPTIPAGLTKEAKALPEFVRMAQDYLEAKLLTLKLNALVAVHRAAGIRELYLTQRPSKTEGFPPELKSLIPHRVLLGPNPSESDVMMAFRDRKRIPPVPGNIASDPQAARGAGIAHLDGSDPVVIKGFFATTSEFENQLRHHLGPGDPSDARVRPTAEQIARCVPRADGEVDMDEDVEETSHSGGRDRAYEDWELDESGRPLTGFERANAARHAAGASAGKPTPKQRAEAKEEAEWAKQSGPVLTTQAEKCPSCDGFVNPSTGHCAKCSA